MMETTNDTVTGDELKIEVLPLDTLGTLVRAEIDMQISTAKAFPRSITAFIKKVESLATVTPSVAESCTYALPRKQLNEKTGQYEKKIITGPSVRFAEIVVSSYGNIRAGSRVIANDGKTLTCQGVCHDLETNTFISVEVKRKITNKMGKTYTEDMQVMAGNAGCAIAFRNAVFKIVPGALTTETYEKVQEVAKGTADTLPARREKAFRFFRQHNITDEQLVDALGVLELNDINLEQLQILSGMKASFVNGEFTMEELFPIETKTDLKGKADAATKETVDMMAGKRK